MSILQQFHSYLLQTSDGGVDGQIFSGDQLTVERALNVILSVANGYTPKDRLEDNDLPGVPGFCPRDETRHKSESSPTITPSIDKLKKTRI